MGRLVRDRSVIFDARDQAEADAIAKEYGCVAAESGGWVPANGNVADAREYIGLRADGDVYCDPRRLPGTVG